MSARKRYYDNYDGSPYKDHELNEQSNYCGKFPKVSQCRFDILCDKWRPCFLSDTVRFMLVSYEYCGATFGIELCIKRDESYVLRTYEESGYVNGSEIKKGMDLTEINKFIDGFEPSRYLFD